MKQLRPLLYGAAALATVAMGTGCSTNLGDFTLLASKNVDLEHFDSQAAEKTDAVSGADTHMFPIFTGPPNLKEATDRAEDNGKASSLTNARIVFNSIPIIKAEIQVTGNPIPK